MTTQFMQTKDGSLAYEVSGSGPLVICVPSMGDLRQEYRLLAPRLVEAGFHTASLDVRGHGESSVHWADFSVAGVGSDILALIDQLGGGPAVVIGTSMAAGAAVWAAAEAPERLRGLVLIGPFVRGGGSPLVNLLMAVMFGRPWGPGMWQRYYTRLYPTQRPDDFASYSSKLRANLAEPGRLEALQGMLRASKSAAEARLPRVSTPALVLMGSKDPDFKDPSREAAWVAQAIHAEFRMLAGAGHYPQAEFPAETAALIIPFMQSLEDDNAAKTPVGQTDRGENRRGPAQP
jgi:pimeloyl-ACP methyl ester carboxylesterase